MYLVVAGSAAAEEKAASFVIDGNSGTVLSKSHADDLRYPASLTKMMTLYLLFDALKSGKLQLDSELVVSERAASQQPSKLDLSAGDTISVSHAIGALVTRSANDVAVAVAENLAGSEEKFARAMTAKAREMGMKRTTFRNASGLPDSGQQTTARDLATLALRLNDDFPEYYPYFKMTYFSYKGERIRNHNGLLFSFEGTDGIKTGYTRDSGFNLVASVRRDGRHVIGVVMGGDTARERNGTMRALLRRGLAVASLRKTRVPAGDLVALAETPKPAKRPKKSVVVASASPAVSGLTNAAVTSWTTEVVPQPVEVVRTSAPQTVIGSTSGKQDAIAALMSATAPEAAAPAPVPVSGYHVQVGAYGSEKEAMQRLDLVRKQVPALLTGTSPVALQFASGQKTFFRARFSGFDQAGALKACQGLKKQNIDCIVMRAQ